MDSDVKSMIPSAATLASILNDPAIPADALPIAFFASVPGTIHVPEHAREKCNHYLFWSLSAWLWGRADTFRVARHRGIDGYAGLWRTADFRYDPSPVEALAEVVRQVAAQGVRATAPPSSSRPSCEGLGRP